MGEQVEQSNLSWTAIQELKKKADNIARTLGFQRAVMYLKRLGLSFEDAHEVLFGCAPRFA